MEMYDGEPFTPRFHDRFKQEKSKVSPGAGPLKRSNALRVLVVDDDFALKVLVTTMLEVHDCLVDRADNGARALDWLAAKPYDLVLTDLYMPVMDGCRLACEIRSQWPDTKVAIMTGSSQEDMQSMVAAGQVDAWLFKPFGLKEISRLLDRFDSL
jgi:two-component system, NarL family, capsular synthesis sensor histidine kinase RcsC